MKRWRWVREDVVYAIHDRQLAEHGGPEGVRDAGALESAMARPRNLAGYERPDAPHWQRRMPMDWLATIRSPTATSERHG